MDTLLLMAVSGIGFIIAYNTYGKFLAHKIFKLDPKAIVPSKRLYDGIDYVPTRKGIIFGHHFASIAGTGPIVGPAIGIIWGWVPAILWVLLGSIFMGAVHDFGALVISLRNDGKSISEVAAKYINRRVRLIFFVIVFLVLWIVIAIFGVVIALVFDSFPSSVIPIWLQIPIAMLLGYVVYKKSGNVTFSTIVAVFGMYVTIVVGAYIEHNWPSFCRMPAVYGMPATGVWTIILLIYGWVASTLPVTVLLQPRDYINAWQLFIMMGLLAVGAVVSAGMGQMPIVAPALNLSQAGIPSMWPLMFVTIACGAFSGFHSLVSSGTSPKQIASESDSLFVGYGSMLVEGVLAVLIIVCVAAGVGMAYKGSDGTILTGVAAWRYHYSSWAEASALKAVVTGAANMMATLKLPEIAGITLMGVFIASFAGTTLDTAVRIQRYVISELASDMRVKFLADRWVATTFAVLTAGGLAFATGTDGRGAMKLWPLFGAANQLLGALALLVITMYLKRQGGYKYLVSALPCILMLFITSWAIIVNECEFFAQKNWLLLVSGAGLFALALWMTVETVIVFANHKVSTAPAEEEIAEVSV